jgi:hypothetical protein
MSLSRLFHRAASCTAFVVAVFGTPLGAQNASAKVDRKAVELLNAMEQALAKTPALEASVKQDRFMPDGRPQLRLVQHVRFVRPNHFMTITDSQIVLLGSGKSEITNAIVATDGEYETTMWSGRKEIHHFKQERPPEFSSFRALASAYKPGRKLHWAAEWNAGRLNDFTLVSLEYLGPENWKGGKYDVVKWVTMGGYFAPAQMFYDTAYFYLGADHLPRRIRTTTSRGSVTEDYYEKIVVDAPLEAADASYQIPPGAKVLSDIMQITANFEKRPYLDFTGKMAPEFSVPTGQGTPYKLSESLARNRYVVIYNWFYG